MARKSDASNRIGFKDAAPVLGAVGALSLAGGASAATTGPVTDTQSLDNTAKRAQITISEEELTDVSLATFYVFDKENTKTPKLQGEQVAWWARCRCGWRCWGCRRCWGCGCRC